MPIAAFLILASGCQLITGTYTVDTLGPNCSTLGLCCGSLASIAQATCFSAFESQDETVCGAILISDCTGTPSMDAGSVLPDAHRPQGDAPGSFPDVAGPPNLDGTWTLTGGTCDMNAVILGAGTTTLTFTTGVMTQVTTLSDGCVETLTLESVTINDTNIVSADGTLECSSDCQQSECESQPTGAMALPYTLSAGTLKISQAVETSQCVSGAIVYDYTME